MDYTALATELAGTHPVTGAYDADDAIAAGQLNAVNRTRLRPLSMMELREWAGLSGRGFAIYSAIADTGLTNQQRNVAYVADKLLGTDDGNLDPGNALHVGMVDVLVSASIISAADKTALVTKATDNVSRAEELEKEFGASVVREGDVQIARAA